MMLCAKGTIVKLCSGSLFLYSGMHEIAFYLKALGLPFSVVPSVGVLDVAFAYLGYEFVSAWNKTVLITRLVKRDKTSSKLICSQAVSWLMPLTVIYLSVRLVFSVSEIFAHAYKASCPVVCVYKAS